jgi:nicotinate-nucleotide adenylyltransferase
VAVTDHSAPADLRSVGVLGGTFNPPHLGHLAVARHARDELDLQLVLLMPARIPPHKPSEEDPGPEHRLRMCELLGQDTPDVAACSLELGRPGPSYTVDTLRSIHVSNPDAELTFILGADIAGTLPAWREPAKLLQLADLAVAARQGPDREALLDALGPLLAQVSTDRGAERPGGITFLSMPAVAVSSSMARERAKRGESIEDLVGPNVAGYIAEHALYRPAAAGRG